jgi:hypothetical protein
MFHSPADVGNNVVSPALDDDEVINTPETFNSDADTIEDVPGMMPTQYNEIMLTCYEVCRQLKHKSNASFMDEVVGFRMLAHRCSTGKW